MSKNVSSQMQINKWQNFWKIKTFKYMSYIEKITIKCFINDICHSLNLLRYIITQLFVGNTLKKEGLSTICGGHMKKQKSFGRRTPSKRSNVSTHIIVAARLLYVQYWRLKQISSEEMLIHKVRENAKKWID